MNQRVKRQKVPASLLHRQDSSVGLLTTSPKVLYCEKCGFASTATEEFENHMQEHLTRFYCFYCNHISYSKKELEVHLLQHKYPFRCQYCGQGYMRRAHLLNHIERLHSKDVGPQCNNTQTTIPETFSLSTTFVPRVHKTNAPTVKVRIPGPVARNDHGNKGRQRCKTADLNVLNAPKVSPQLISPMKNFVQHNMALTVPLPEEVSIPAGCMVELIEMKTVNGTKELKLRLVSHQQNTSVLDDPVLQHSTSVNPFSTALNPRNLFGNSKTCVNSKKPTVNNSNVWHPPTFQTNVDKNALNTFHSGMSGTKKTLQESVIHNVEIPYALPTRVPRISEYPSRQSMAEPTAQAETMKPKIDHSAPIVAGKTAKKVTNSANQAIKEALSSCKTPQRENKLVVECPGIPLELQNNRVVSTARYGREGASDRGRGAGEIGCKRSGRWVFADKSVVEQRE
ncbi:hypothetical protein NHX12_010787 [Muraenolepis orangiensis]|uniref:C2H2-type domain-containing protein n=1 Tax=Muraenolepis orangiensis TaxID=630683 RepID=A0A9Q0DEZ5_9TELE|nr:hypothetical protein NHX12_010787 [Muraenolepis orangiensis]